jgi:hypothetical protein
MARVYRRILLAISLTVVGAAQTAVVVPASMTSMPAPIVDGNSPGVWVDGELRVFTSTGQPMLMSGPSILELSFTDLPIVTPADHYPLWIEAVWRDDDGTIYGWYHHERGGLCGGKLAAPEIGALVSTDGGQTFLDLGIVIASGDPINCGAQNGFFAGGHGDFSVILDQDRRYFYFLFGNYGGPAANQGVAIARMAFEDRVQPVGAVYKFANGEWTEPGVGGAVSPILRARVAWDRSNTDSFWGPAIHCNTAIERYVVLLNHACCKPNWPQEGIYVMFGQDLSDPGTWTTPTKILDASQIGFAPGYYPEVFGLGMGETDSIAGQLPRLFIKGVSRWQILFAPPAPPDSGSEEPPGGEPPSTDPSPPQP